MDAEKKLVLVTGSAGNVGRCVCAALRPHCTVRGFDLAPSPDVDESHTGTLTDRAAVDRAMPGVHTVVHLAAHPNNDADFMTELLRPNVEGLWHVYDSARAAGVRRMIFASSCHTIFGHPSDQPLTPADLPRVSNPYGATKVFGEVLGQHFHDAHGLEFLAVRIGFFTPRGRDEPLLRTSAFLRAVWLSPRDCGQIFRRAVEAPAFGHGIIFATSKIPGERLSLATARTLLGYEPEDDVGTIPFVG